MLLMYAIFLTPAVIVLGMFLDWFYKYCVKEYCLFKFKNAPKAWPYPFGHMFELQYTDERLFDNLRKWGKDHYPMYKLTCGLLSCLNITGPEEIEEIVSTTKHMQKSRIYELLERWLGFGLLLEWGPKWQQRRKVLTPAFHFNILQKFIPVFVQESENLVQDLHRSCRGKEQVLDVIPLITEFALHSISETAMGLKLDLKNQQHLDYKNSIYDLGVSVVHRLVRPWFWLQPIYYYLTIPGLKERSLIKKLHKFTRDIIRAKAQKFEANLHQEESYSKRKTMALLDILLSAKYKDGTIDDNGIFEEVDTFMFEGHDTTSMAICLGLMALANQPVEQQLIYEEITQICGSSNPTYDQLVDMKYTERCIKEILRLYPSVPFISRYLTEDWTTKSGYTFKKQTVVNIHIFDLHRNPELYKDPLKFDPDRFLAENIQKRHPFAYIPFSAGPRNCIGQRFAILEMKAAICAILQQFKLEPVDTPENITFIPHIILKPKHGLRVKFVKRL